MWNLVAVKVLALKFYVKTHNGKVFSLNTLRVELLWENT